MFTTLSTSISITASGSHTWSTADLREIGGSASGPGIDLIRFTLMLKVKQESEEIKLKYNKTKILEKYIKYWKLH